MGGYIGGTDVLSRGESHLIIGTETDSPTPLSHSAGLVLHQVFLVDVICHVLCWVLTLQL